MRNEYVDDHAKEVLSKSVHPTRLGAVEANKFYPEQVIETARLIRVDLAKGVAEVERYATVDKVYWVDVLPAYWLCSKMEKAAAQEAKRWAGCPRNYLSY